MGFAAVMIDALELAAAVMILLLFA